MPLSNELYHHGIKGQKWGVRRYQYPDGSYTPAGRARYGAGKSKHNLKSHAANAILSAYGKVKMRDVRLSGVGKRYADTYLTSGTPLYRIQSFYNLENFAFYATYEKRDVEEYAGLFGKNLIARANAQARAAEKKAKVSGDYDTAKQLREKADGMEVFQLKIENTSKLKIPSEENASYITGKLLKDSSFKSDLAGSIASCAKTMKRPSQQMLLRDAAKAISKDANKITDGDKRAIYRALNLSLVNHNEQDIRVQDKFYGAMKKNGYSALLDLNDKVYSSYHAKSPVIVFDTTKVRLQSVTKLNADTINSLYKKHNRRRIVADIPEQAIGSIARSASMKMSSISSSAVNNMLDYLNT